MNDHRAEQKRQEEEQMEKMKAEIHPLVQSVLDGRIKLKEVDYLVFQIRWGALNQMLDCIMGWPETLFSNTESKTIGTDLFAYLGLVETMGNSIVDIVVMLVIGSGKDFHIESEHRTPRVRHVEELSDLRRVPLTTKLNFLRDNGIKTLPLMIDSKLRNDIAHLNFTFDPDTKEIFIRNKPAKDALLQGFKELNTLYVAFEEIMKIDEVMKSQK